MKIGVRAHDFGRHEEAELARAIREAGFEAVQLAPAKALTGIGPGEIPPARLKSIQAAFQAQEVEISVLGCYIEPSLPDREERLAQVARFLTGLEQAKALGVPVVGTETTRFDPSPANEPNREKAYLALRDSLLRMAEGAERLGVQIGIEPVADHTLNSVELTLRLLEEVGSDKVRIIFDPVNMLLAGTADSQQEIFRRFLEGLGDRIAALHMKDIVFEAGEKVWRNLGHGIVRYDAIFPGLKALGFDGPLLREHVKPDSCHIDLAQMRRLAEK